MEKEQRKSVKNFGGGVGSSEILIWSFSES